MALHTSDESRTPGARCGRNHRHASREQVGECEARFAARAALRRAEEAEGGRAGLTRTRAAPSYADEAAPHAAPRFDPR